MYCTLFTYSICTNCLLIDEWNIILGKLCSIQNEIMFYFLSRFSLNVCRVVHNHVMTQVRDILGKRGLQQPSDLMLRNHIKFLSSACGISDVRLFITEKFDQWIVNAKVCVHLTYMYMYSCICTWLFCM